MTIADYTLLETSDKRSGTINYNVNKSNVSSWTAQDSAGAYYFGNTATTRWNYDNPTAVGNAIKAWGDVAIGITGASVSSGGNLTVIYGDFINNVPTPKHLNSETGTAATGVTQPFAFLGTITNSYIGLSHEASLLSSTLAGKQNLLHEIGHALGIQHPGGNGTLTGWDQSMSVMSYVGIGKPITTPMIYDIAAIQHKMGGANTTTHSAGTHYGLTNIAGVDNVTIDGTSKAWTIWDAGGVDTIDASQGTWGNRAAYIDLRGGVDEASGKARFSTIGDEKIAIAWQYGHSTDNLAVEIEVAKGTGLNDTIYGGVGNNTLYGNAGNDQMFGGNGNDTLYGDAGNDKLLGGSGDDRIYGGATLSTGLETLDGGLGNDYMIGDYNSPAYYLSHYGHDTISIGGGARGSTVYVDNYSGAGNGIVDLYLSGTASQPGKATIKGKPDGIDPLPAGATETGTHLYIHGTNNDSVSGFLGDFNDILDFTSGRFVKGSTTVGVGLGNDTINLHLNDISNVIILGSQPATGLDNNDVLQIDGVTKTGTMALLQYDHSKSSGNLIWDGGNGYAVIRTNAQFEFIKLDSNHFAKDTVHPQFYNYIGTSDYAALIEDQIATPVSDVATALPFNLSLAAFHAGSDVANINLG